MSPLDQQWTVLAKKLRGALSLDPPTPEEAAKAIAQIEAGEMRPEEVSAIVQSVLKGSTPAELLRLESPWVDGRDRECVAEDSLVLNRNAGDEDEEVQRRLDKLRREALDDEDGEDDEAGVVGG